MTTVSVVPMPENFRIDLVVEPQAVKALDGSTMQDSFRGIWFTNFTPMFSSYFMIEMEAGRIISKIPRCLVNLSIWLSSRYVEGISGKCGGTTECSDYFNQVRARFTTLRTILNIVSSDSGAGNVVKKILGDFEIGLDYRDGDASLVTRLLDELRKLEPVVLSGGCLGIGQGLPPMGVVKGRTDPYRPLIGRTWFEPVQGTSGRIIGKDTTNRNYGSYRPNRYRGRTRRPR